MKSTKKIVEEQMDSQGDDLSFNVHIVLWPYNNEEEAVLKELQSLSSPNFVVTKRWDFVK